MNRLLFVFASLLLAGACQGDPKIEARQLEGSWQGSAWLVSGKPSGRDAGAVHFVFEPGGKYIAAYGDQQEQGTFRLKGNKLYTTAQDKIEKMVKVLNATPDSLEFDMNRAGLKEKLLLVRMK